jgi:hypothetical protein
VKYKRKKVENIMGLDMYAYVANKRGQYNEFYENAEFDGTTNDFESDTVTKPHELAYWRKHPSLHGWMEQLWVSKGRPRQSVGWPIFNGIELELTWDDLDNLERAIRHGKLPDTEGFFFGSPADNHYYEQDLEFVNNAKAEVFLGLKVFYNSSW